MFNQRDDGSPRSDAGHVRATELIGCWGLPLAALVSCVLSVCLIGGCRSDGMESGKRRDVHDISPERFILLYNAPGTIANEWRYRGLVGDYHVLDYYDMGTGDWRVYQYSLRTHKDLLPPGFPAKP